MAKAKNPKYRSPKAVASYPYFNKPDEFKGSKRYKADLIMDREEAAPLIEQCEQVLTAYIEAHNAAIKSGEAKGKPLNLKKALTTGLPFEDHETDDSKVVFKVKQNAEVNGEEVRLMFFDAKGKRIKKAPLVRGGSIVKVAGTIRGYEGFGGGVTLSISAVQILQLNEGGSDMEDGSAFGFGEEDGFDTDADDFENDNDPDFDPDNTEEDDNDSDTDKDEDEDF